MVQLLVLATALSSEAEAEVGRRALLVGANDGGIDLPALRYTQNDVARMEDVLVELGGFEPEDIVVLQGPDGATLAVELELAGHAPLELVVAPARDTVIERTLKAVAAPRARKRPSVRPAPAPEPAPKPVGKSDIEVLLGD